jgi:Rieske Fe-S protein
VAYKKGVNRIECPCHGSRFDIEGKVLKGPATKDLKGYDAELKDQHIVFSFR